MTKLIGKGANQVPVNGFLGNMAFQDKASVEVDALTVNGNVGLGVSNPNEPLTVQRNGTAVAGLSPSTVASFQSTSATTQSTYVSLIAGSSGSTAQAAIFFGDADDPDIGQVLYRNADDSMDFVVNASSRMKILSDGVVRPATDNIQPIGGASFRWSVVYAGTGTINTSDEREKQQIADLDDAERRVAVSIKGLVKKYKYNDAVTLKGDGARIHVGVIAQEVIAAFAAEGLDATRYALLCHDTWEAEPEEVDKNGNVINPGIEAGERYGIRYDELLAFMIAAL